jgi:hypothetical protein
MFESGTYCRNHGAILNEAKKIIMHIGFVCAVTAQSVQLWATAWTAGVRFPAGTRDFSVLHSVQTGSGAHQTSNPMGTGDS